MQSKYYHELLFDLEKTTQFKFSHPLKSDKIQTGWAFRIKYDRYELRYLTII